MNNLKTFGFFAALIAFFIVLDMASCSQAKADDFDLNVVEAEFFESEIDYEAAQLEEYATGPEAMEPDNRKPAHHVPTPKVFVDSDIKRTLKDGTVQKFDGDQYMIVRRTHTHKKPVKCKPQIIKEKVVEKKPMKRAVSVMLGHGPTDRLDVDRNNINGAASVRNSTGIIGTLQYQQTFHKEGWFWSGQLQTNEAVSVGIGKGF